ncbi:MAG TPA: poly-beta-1,6-N-acetyl-D-glucosamine N-deacetylase PgaB [Methylophaga sp.]|nr:poly-beta-1,6-N-acetyl-D-glucosamine N-deacetylase PgaB [Methylophaga sp.]
MQFRKIILFLAFILISGTCSANDEFLVLCYHDVRDDVDGIVDDDQMAISTDNLIAQFSWLREHNYHVISLDDVIAAKQGKKPLPENAILLTFDDGYKSTFTHVLPLLQQYQYPAVVALVGKWLETPEGEKVYYGTKDIKSRDFFMDWDEIKTMADSGLVEFASHSYDLHRGILGNPFGNTQPITTTFEYDNKKQKYSSVIDHTTHLLRDLKKNNELIEKQTGIKLRTMVWPYGEYSRLSENIASQQGLVFSLTLEDGKNTIQQGSRIKRLLIQGNPALEDFVYLLRHPEPEEPIRVAHVDLDYVYDPDPVQQNKNLSLLLDRIKSMKINTVFLQAFADSDGDGNADALYFPNRHLPMKADLFNRVAWQLRTRSGVNVYAWMPLLSFVVPDTESLRVHHLKEGRSELVRSDYLRLSPFNKKARTIIEEIYQDLAMHAHFEGLLFHDDAYLNDFEDMSPAALQYAAIKMNKPDLSIEDLRGSEQDCWTRLKTEALTDFSLRLAQQVKYYRPQIKTARNMYANVLFNQQSETWFSQSYPNMLQNYDYTAIMAMPYMEQVEHPEQWLSQLIQKARIYDPKLEKTLFELQSVDWNTQQALSDPLLKEQFRLLMRSGVKHIGYYPDGFLNNQPRLSTIKSSISLSVFPFER